MHGVVGSNCATMFPLYSFLYVAHIILPNLGHYYDSSSSNQILTFPLLSIGKGKLDCKLHILGLNAHQDLVARLSPYGAFVYPCSIIYVLLILKGARSQSSTHELHSPVFGAPSELQYWTCILFGASSAGFCLQACEISMLQQVFHFLLEFDACCL